MVCNYCIIIYGPTAVGKSDFALLLAQQIPAEIINMDVGQFYTPLKIGTAKPDWCTNPLRHHLFDICDKPKNITVLTYRQQVIACMRDIWKRNKIPLIVGGSGFYAHSLFFPPLSIQSSANQEIDLPTADLWNLLYTIDPQRACSIHKNDLYRIKRALTIWYTTGKKPSEYIPSFDPPSSFLLIGLMREKDDLYARINNRVVAMIKDGWIEEVSSLLGTPWVPFLKEKKIIGYDEIINFLLADTQHENLPEIIEVIQKKTRLYAKRQITFWRMMKKEVFNALSAHSYEAQSAIESLNLTSTDVHLYINQLSSKLKNV